MSSDPAIDMANDWKLLTLLIGVRLPPAHGETKKREVASPS